VPMRPMLVPVRARKRRLSRIALLPTLLTLGNLLCGFASIHFAAKHLASATVFSVGHARLEQWLPSNLAIAAYLIFVAMVFDALDGRVARLTRRTSDFGGQLDSLADVVSFGIAPAILLIAAVSRALADDRIVGPLSEQFGGRIVWLIAAFYACCAALRLARFNVENVHDESAHLSFKGLPSPGAGGTLAAVVILYEEVLRRQQVIGRVGGLADQMLIYLMPALTLALALLMVSRIRYVHAVNRYLRGKRPWWYLVRVILLAAAFVVYPQLVLAAAMLAYAASGPAVAAYRRLGGTRRPAAPAEPASARHGARAGGQVAEQTGPAGFAGNGSTD